MSGFGLPGTNVWFVRHGESVSNANLPTAHPAESALTPNGLLQAARLAHAFDTEPDLIVVSTFSRAQQTAIPLTQRCPSVPVEEWPVYEFTYLAPARYNGTTGVDRAPAAQAYWQKNDPAHRDLGEGDSFVELLARVHEVVGRIRRRREAWIVVFSHGLFLRALFWAMLTGTDAATPDAMNRFSHFVRAVRMPNGAISRAHFSRDGRFALSPSDVSHLPPELRD